MAIKPLNYFDSLVEGKTFKHGDSQLSLNDKGERDKRRSGLSSILTLQLEF